METTVYVELLPDHPAYGRPEEFRFEPSHPGDAGIDLIVCEEVSLAPGERRLVSGGIRIALPPGVEGQVRPRSGNALKRGLTIANTPGTIDPGYRGPIMLILQNTQPAVTLADLRNSAGDGMEGHDGVYALRERIAAGIESRTVRIERGERVAQVVFVRFERLDVEIVDEVPKDTARGAGGFGSTGTGAASGDAPVGQVTADRGIS